MTLARVPVSPRNPRACCRPGAAQRRQSAGQGGRAQGPQRGHQAGDGGAPSRRLLPKQIAPGLPGEGAAPHGCVLGCLRARASRSPGRARRAAGSAAAGGGAAATPAAAAGPPAGPQPGVQQPGGALAAQQGCCIAGGDRPRRPAQAIRPDACCLCWPAGVGASATHTTWPAVYGMSFSLTQGTLFAHTARSRLIAG